MSKAIAKVFDYSQVGPDEKGKLIRLSGQLKRHGETMLSAGNEIRKIVSEAHVLLAHHRAGLFDEWIESESEISLSTAYNCLNVEKRASDFPILESLPPTVAYMLAGPKVPDKAIQDFEKQVEKGAKPTIEAAKATIKKFREANTRAKATKPKSASPPPVDPIEAACSHEWTSDTEGEFCAKCKVNKPKISGGTTFDVAEIEAVTEAEAATEPGKLFGKIFDHLGKATRLLDDLNKVAPNAKFRQDVFDSLECANQDLHKWKRGVKK